MNVVVLSGRLTMKPNIKDVQNGKYTFAEFSIAVPRSWKPQGADKYESDFFEIRCSGNNAKFCEKYLDKGIKVEVEGSLEQQKWKDKEGKNMSKVTVNARSIRFAESKGSGGSSSAPAVEKKDDFVSVPEGVTEELPFT